MTNTMFDPSYRQQLRRTLSHDGKFRVIFVHQPDYPDVFEFISMPSDNEPRIRYINMDARQDANISVLIN